ncbi:hypothetical protein ABH940_003491 [Streptacidiphilus sp. BW17]|uniref:hypothetical protein n=1 Tax=Streptacidiphilus sp. BW17 TaxID=3156274 RepID=UPI0035192049
MHDPLTDDRPRRSTVTRSLVLGDAALQYSLTPRPAAPLVVVELESEEADTPRAVEFVRPDQSNSQRVHVIDRVTRGIQSLASPFRVESWRGGSLGLGLRALLEDRLAASVGPEDLDALSPLLLLRTTNAGDTASTDVLVCSRVRSVGTVFIRVSRIAHDGDTPLVDLVTDALAALPELRDHIRIQAHGYTTFEAGTEIEQKINLLAPVPIWGLAGELWTAIDRGDFPGYMTDPGYELTRWHFVQHNFEISGPDGEQGHFGFQEQPDGTYQLKHKRFAADAIRREESFRKGLEIPDRKFAEFLQAEYPKLQVRPLAGFVRTRFDLNVESCITGHYFGIEIDEVTTLEDQPRRLRQVELEYLQTRVHHGMASSTIDADLEELTAGVERHLARRDIAAERSLYSKLSFLRDGLQSP